MFTGLRKEYLFIAGNERNERKNEGLTGILFSPVYLYGLVSEAFSTAFLVPIVYYVIKGNSPSWIGYLILMLSHVLRFTAILSDNPWIFLLGEFVRPLGLIIIMLGTVKRR